MKEIAFSQRMIGKKLNNLPDSTNILKGLFTQTFGTKVLTICRLSFDNFLLKS